MSIGLETVRPASREAEALCISDLDETIERLVHRHLDTTKEWFPHELVPWDRASEVDFSTEWQPEHSTLSEPARVALFVNLLTEDNLPYYMFELATLGRDGPWGEWTRRWTAEEGRHAIVMRDYLTVTRALDPVALERGRMQQVSTGVSPQFDILTDALVYVTLQELATRISHRNTGKLMDDRAGVEVMNRVAADENLHYLFYRDLATAAIELAPSPMVMAIERTVRGFAMPGTGITDFAAHSRTMAAAHVYDFAIHHDRVIAPVVLQHWNLETITGLDAEAEAARDRTLTFIARLERAARRINERSATPAQG